MSEQAPPRKHSLRAIFNALRWLVRAGCPWRMMPHDLPPWPAVQQQTQRWVRAGSFENMAHDLRLLLRLAAQRNDAPSAAILDSRTLQSTPERTWSGRARGIVSVTRCNEVPSFGNDGHEDFSEKI